MVLDVYAHLADALDRLPNGYPRTSSGIELKILKKIFPPEDAELACQLTGNWETVDGIAARSGLPTGETRDRLFQMVRRGMVWLDKVDGKPKFRLAPFVVGIYEMQISKMDEEEAMETLKRLLAIARAAHDVEVRRLGQQSGVVMKASVSSRPSPA